MNAFIGHIKEFFNDTSIYLSSYDKNNIRLGCKDTNVYMNISIEYLLYAIDKDLFYSNPSTEHIFNTLNLYINERGNINRDSLIESMLYKFSKLHVYDEFNSSLKWWGHKILSFDDRWVQGFLKDNYAEFIIEKNENISLNDIKNTFLIDGVKVTIENPSYIFRLIFQSLETVKRYKSEWDDFYSISFRSEGDKLSKSNIEFYLQQSIFILNIIYPDVFIFGSHENSFNTYEVPNIESSIPSNFPKSKHIEPLVYYNEGVISTQETAFYYFYKVLEFYFDINTKSLISDKIISLLNRDNADKNELSEATDEIISINGRNKKYLLSLLLNNENIAEQVREVLVDFFFIKNDSSLNKYIEKLYDYRNRVIHSEDNNRRIPKLLLDSYHDDILSMKEWNELARRLALICINYFSYDYTLLI